MESSKKFTPLLVEAPIIYTWGSVPVVGFHNIWGWRHMKSFFNARGRSLASTKKKKVSCFGGSILFQANKLHKCGALGPERSRTKFLQVNICSRVKIFRVFLQICYTPRYLHGMAKLSLPVGAFELVHSRFYLLMILKKLV